MTLLFFFTYYSLRAQLFQIPGQQHGGGQGGQRRGLAAQDARAKAGGIASVSGWVRTLDAVESGSLKLEAPLADGLSKGSMLFALQCNVCHGLGGPRIDIIPRVRRLTRYGLEAQLQGQGTRLGYMPPFAGNLADRQALADYLERMGAQRQTIPSPEAQ